jgi:hypothetical protein
MAPALLPAIAMVSAFAPMANALDLLFLLDLIARWMATAADTAIATPQQQSVSGNN